MAFNLMSGALAAVILQSRKLPQQQVLAGAVLSSMTPGVLGLAIPLILANRAPPPTDTGSGSDGGAVPASVPAVSATKGGGVAVSAATGR